MLADWMVGCAAAGGLRTVRAWCLAAGMPPLRVWERALWSMGLTLPWHQRGAGAARCDVRLAADRENLVSAAAEHFGQIDVLVNNAGVAYSGPAEEESAEHWQDLIDTNLTRLFALTQLVGRHMLDRGDGTKVNVASPAAAISVDRYGLAGYGATKAGVVALTRELAAHWGGRGIRVNALAPSFFPTATSGFLQDPDQVAWIRAHTPLGRPPRPDELDWPLLFLASDASSYVTGGRPSWWTAAGPAASSAIEDGRARERANPGAGAVRQARTSLPGAR
jgi:NAD(P)-dependent dehydrogenase (short-subunit alcohol dehydrogenase family)